MTPPRPGQGRHDAHAGWAVLGTLLSGIVVWTVIGYLLDRLLGTSFLVVIGLLAGFGLSIYLVWVKYAKP